MKSLVITTINRPTLALQKYQDILLDQGWKIIVVGDKKTPTDFQLPGAEYLSIDRQNELFGDLSSLIPLNHYSRKSLGYLYAMSQGSEIIAESDDDNIPYPENYPNFLPSQIKTSLLEDRGSVNVYSYFTNKKIWPRGLPLDMINKLVNTNLINEQNVTCYIQQGLADLDPDVDAIYRLTVASENVIFERNKALALGDGCYSPFNTQNTLFYRKAFPLMLLPIDVHSRVTDIWRGYIAQKLLWCMGANLLFLSPSVYQIRNEHNLVKDLTEEVPLYTQVHELIYLLEEFKKSTTNSCDLMLEMYDHLHQMKFFSQKEMWLCTHWIDEVKKYV
jgi:hypothetical protein